MRRENRGGMVDLLFDGNRSEFVAVRAAQERKLLAGFARLIAQGEMQINRLIIGGRQQGLRGLLAGFGTQEQQRGLLPSLGIVVEGRENFRGLVGGQRGDAQRLQRLVGDYRVGIILAKFLQLRERVRVVIEREFALRTPIKRVVAQQLITLRDLQPFRRLRIVRFAVIVVSQGQRGAITHHARRFLQRQGAELGIGRGGIFLFQGARQLLQLFCGGCRRSGGGGGYARGIRRSGGVFFGCGR